MSTKSLTSLQHSLHSLLMNTPSSLQPWCLFALESTCCLLHCTSVICPVGNTEGSVFRFCRLVGSITTLSALLTAAVWELGVGHLWPWKRHPQKPEDWTLFSQIWFYFYLKNWQIHTIPAGHFSFYFLARKFTSTPKYTPSNPLSYFCHLWGVRLWWQHFQDVSPDISFQILLGDSKTFSGQIREVSVFWVYPVVSDQTSPENFHWKVDRRVPDQMPDSDIHSNVKFLYPTSKADPSHHHLHPSACWLVIPDASHVTANRPSACWMSRSDEVNRIISSAKKQRSDSEVPNWDTPLYPAVPWHPLCENHKQNSTMYIL